MGTRLASVSRTSRNTNGGRETWGCRFFKVWPGRSIRRKDAPHTDTNGPPESFACALATGKLGNHRGLSGGADILSDESRHRATKAFRLVANPGVDRKGCEEIKFPGCQSHGTPWQYLKKPISPSRPAFVCVSTYVAVTGRIDIGKFARRAQILTDCNADQRG